MFIDPPPRRRCPIERPPLTRGRGTDHPVGRLAPRGILASHPCAPPYPDGRWHRATAAGQSARAVHQSRQTSHGNPSLETWTEPCA